MLIGSVFITAAGIYLLYRGYVIGVKHEIVTKDNPGLPKDQLKDPDGYCKCLSRMFNFMGLCVVATGVIAFLDDAQFIKLGYWIYLVFGILIVIVTVSSVILNKLLQKYY